MTLDVINSEAFYIVLMNVSDGLLLCRGFRVDCRIFRIFCLGEPRAFSF